MPFLHLTHVPIPEASRERLLTYADIGDAEHAAIEARRPELLAALHRGLENHLNTPGVYAQQPTPGAIDRAPLTGEYFVSREWYSLLRPDDAIRIRLQCHFLERANGAGASAEAGLVLVAEMACEPDVWYFAWREVRRVG